MNVKLALFKGLLTEVLLLLSGGMLLYANYMQDSGTFSVKMEMPSIKGTLSNFRAFRLFFLPDDTNYSSGNFNSGITKIEHPYPQLDMSYIGPVFFENGTLYLHCETEFLGLKCKPKGIITPEKVYLSSSLFDDARYEYIKFSFKFEDMILFLFGKKSINSLSNGGYPFNKSGTTSFIKSNRESMILFTNYGFLFGQSGSCISNFNSGTYDEINQTNICKEHLIDLSSKVEILVFLLLIKDLNFILFSAALGGLFLMHLPFYLFSYVNPAEATFPLEESAHDDDEEYILESIPGLFSISNTTLEEKISAKYRSTDVLCNNYYFGYSIITLGYCAHFVLYFICCLILLGMTEKILLSFNANENGTLPDSKLTSPEPGRRWFHDIEQKGETLTSFLRFCKLSLNFIIFTVCHWLYGFLLFVYSKSI